MSTAKFTSYRRQRLFVMKDSYSDKLEHFSFGISCRSCSQTEEKRWKKERERERERMKKDCSVVLRIVLRQKKTFFLYIWFQTLDNFNQNVGFYIWCFASFNALRCCCRFIGHFEIWHSERCLFVDYKANTQMIERWMGKTNSLA